MKQFDEKDVAVVCISTDGRCLSIYSKTRRGCPAGWEKGANGMKPTAEGMADYLNKEGTNL